MKYVTKSRSEARGEKGKSGRIVLIRGRKEPSWAARNELIIGENEFRENLVTVGFIQLPSGVSTVNPVFVIMIESVAFTFFCLGEAIRVDLPRFVENDQFGLICRLPRFAEVSPEAGFFHKVAATVEKIATGFGGDLSFSVTDGWQQTHVSRSLGDSCAGREKGEDKNKKKKGAHGKNVDSFVTSGQA